MFYKNFFYFDIETVSNYKNFTDFKNNDERGSNLFIKRFENNTYMSNHHINVEESYLEYGGIFSTYGKIICISFGYFHNKNEKGYTIASIYGDNEKHIVDEFNTLLCKVSQKNMILSGYKINSFDIPYILHKLNKYGIAPSKLIDIYGIKPWDTKIIDLADDWKQKFNHYNTFDEVTYELDIDSPKNDIDGSMVHNVYWELNDINRIKTYCEKDVYTTMMVGKKMYEHRL